MWVKLKTLFENLNILSLSKINFCEFLHFLIFSTKADLRAARRAIGLALSSLCCLLNFLLPILT